MFNNLSNFVRKSQDVKPIRLSKTVRLIIRDGLSKI